MHFGSARAGLLGCAAFALIAAPGAALAGGGSFTDDAPQDTGPSYFGFVRDQNGAPIAGAKITVSIKAMSSTLILRTDPQGHYTMQGFDKSIDPKDVDISCSKEGYTDPKSTRIPPSSPTAPVEIDCTLQKE